MRTSSDAYGTPRRSLPVGTRSAILANRNRQQKLTECRRLLRTPPPAAETGPVATDHRDRYEALTGRSLRRCPRCHDGNMQAGA